MTSLLHNTDHPNRKKLTGLLATKITSLDLLTMVMLSCEFGTTDQMRLSVPQPIPWVVAQGGSSFG
jgi:hypothetical protein